MSEEEFKQRNMTSRQSSRFMDSVKIDVFGPDIPIYIQNKKQMVFPNFFALKGVDGQPTDKPFVLYWTKTKKAEKNIIPVGEVVVCEASHYEELLAAKVELDMSKKSWKEPKE